MTKFKIYLSLLLLNFISLANATVIHPSSKFSGCDDVKSLAQEVMLFRLKGAPQKWMIQQMKQRYGTANDLHALIGIKLTEKAFKYEIPRDQSGRSALIKTLQLITTMNVRNPFQIVINLKKKITVLTHPWKGKF